MRTPRREGEREGGECIQAVPCLSEEKLRCCVTFVPLASSADRPASFHSVCLCVSASMEGGG